MLSILVTSVPVEKPFAVFVDFITHSLGIVYNSNVEWHKTTFEIQGKGVT